MTHSVFDGADVLSGSEMTAFRISPLGGSGGARFAKPRWGVAREGRKKGSASPGSVRVGGAADGRAGPVAMVVGMSPLSLDMAVLLKQNVDPSRPFMVSHGWTKRANG